MTNLQDLETTKIQSLVRSHLARKNIKQLNNAALVVQKKVKKILSKTDFYKPYTIIVKSLREKGKLLNCLHPHLIRQTTSFLDITNQLRFKNTCRSFYRMKMFKTSSFPPYYASKLNFHRVKNKIIGALYSNPEMRTPEMSMTSFYALKDPIRCRVEGFSHRDILAILSQNTFRSIHERIVPSARRVLSYLNGLESLSPEERTIYDTLNSNPEIDITSEISLRDPNQCRVEGFSHREILTILSQDKFGLIKEWTPKSARRVLSYLNGLESLSPEERTIYDTLNSNPEMHNLTSTAALKNPNICRVEGFSHRDILTILSRDKFNSIIVEMDKRARRALSYLNTIESLSREERTIYETLNSNPEIDLTSENSLSDPNLCRVEGFSHRDILTILSRDKFGLIEEWIPRNARRALSDLNGNL